MLGKKIYKPIDTVEKCNAYAAFSMMGLTSMDCENKRHLGMSGMHGRYAATKALAECDLIVGAGVRFTERATGNKEKFVYRHFLEKYNIELTPSEIQECITISETYNYTFEMIDFLIDACPKVRANDFDILRDIIIIFYRNSLHT